MMLLAVCRLFDWGAEGAEAGPSHTYAPLISSDGSQFWEDLYIQSRTAQLKAAIAALRSTPGLAVQDAVRMYHTAGQAYLDELGFLDYTAGQGRLQRSDSCIFFANDNYNDLSGALKSVTQMLRKRTEQGIQHVVIMPCWSHQRFSRPQVERTCQLSFQGKWRLLGVYSTAPVVQCSAPRRSSVDTTSTDSSSDTDLNRPGQQSQVPELLPHLVIAFSLDKDKKRQRVSDDSESLLIANKHRLSIPAADADGSDAAGPSASPSSNLTTPSSKPLSPMGSLPSIPEQASLKTPFLS